MGTFGGTSDSFLPNGAILGVRTEWLNLFCLSMFAVTTTTTTTTTPGGICVSDCTGESDGTHGDRILQTKKLPHGPKPRDTPAAVPQNGVLSTGRQNYGFLHLSHRYCQIDRRIGGGKPM